MNNNITSLKPILVNAKYKFEGRNNDELSFSKNDVITVTQQLDGGSLDGRVGWFPADFVNIVTTSVDNQNNKKPAKTTKNRLEIDLSKLEMSKAAFRVQLVQEFLTKEHSKLEMIEKALDAIRFLASELKSDSEDLINFAILKLTEFVNFKRNFFKRFEEELRKPITNQHIGELLLTAASGLSSILRSYCEKYCDLLERINSKSAKISKLLLDGRKTDLKSLILGLSLVFRHVQKYSSALQEIERNTLENHPDRGNLQRAAHFYSDLLEDCEMIRKQREAQLDFLQTPFFQDKFEKNFDVQNLGRICYIGKVSLTTFEDNTLEEEKRINSPVELDRTIVVFSNNILLLDMQTMSGQYSLCNNFSTLDLYVTQLSDVRNTLQFKKAENIFNLQCSKNKEFINLLNSLRSININITTTSSNNNNNFHQKTITKNNNNIQKNELKNKFFTSSNIKVDHNLEMIFPDDGIDDENNKRYTSVISTSENLSNGCLSGSSVYGNRQSRPFSGLSIKPLPPKRSEWFSNNNSVQQLIKLRKGLTPEEQEDALLLKIVDGYCVSSGCFGASSSINNYGGHQQKCCPYYYRQKQRNSADSHNNVNSCGGGGPIRRASSYPDRNEMASTTLTRPQLIVAENEKIFVEEMEGDQIVLKERSLVDTVYTLKDNLAALTKQVSELTKSLEHEQRSRRRLEELIRQTTTIDQTQSEAS